MTRQADGTLLVQHPDATTTLLAAPTDHGITWTSAEDGSWTGTAPNGASHHLGADGGQAWQFPQGFTVGWDGITASLWDTASTQPLPEAWTVRLDGTGIERTVTVTRPDDSTIAMDASLQVVESTVLGVSHAIHADGSQTWTMPGGARVERSATGTLTAVDALGQAMTATLDEGGETGLNVTDVRGVQAHVAPDLSLQYMLGDLVVTDAEDATGLYRDYQLEDGTLIRTRNGQVRTDESHDRFGRPLNNGGGHLHASLGSHQVVHYTDFDGHDRALYNLHDAFGQLLGAPTGGSLLADGSVAHPLEGGIVEIDRLSGDVERRAQNGLVELRQVDGTLSWRLPEGTWISKPPPFWEIDLYDRFGQTFYLAHDADGSVRVVMRDVNALYSFRPDTLELETTSFAGVSLLQDADGTTVVVDPDQVLPGLTAAHAYTNGFVVQNFLVVPCPIGLSRVFPDGSSMSRDPQTGVLSLQVPEANSTTTAEPDGTYTVTSPTGTVRRFDAGGTLVETSLRSGLRMVFDPTGMAYDVHLPDGLCARVGLVGDDLLAVKTVVQEGVGPGVIPALSGHLSFSGLYVEKNIAPAWHLAPDLTLEGYDSQGRLVSRSYVDGRIETFNTTGTLVHTTFADGSVATPQVDGSTHTVDAEGETIAIRGADGILATAQPDGTWHLVHANGAVTDYLVDGTRQETRNGVVTLYRADGSRARRVDAQGTTEYDAAGTPVAYTSTEGVHGHFLPGPDGGYLRKMDDGTEATFSADDTLQRTVNPSGLVTLYDASGRKTAEIDEHTGIFTRFTHENGGGVTGTRSDGRVDHYDAGGVLLRSVLADGTEVVPGTDGVTLQRATSRNGLVVTDAIDGSRTWQLPDGTVVTRGTTGSLEALDADETALVVTTQASDGALKIARPDGTWTFIRVDGTIEHDAADATTLLERLDLDGSHTVVASGLKTVTHADGSFEVSTLDDTPVREQRRDGSETRYNPDGSQVEVSSTGTVLSITLQDGREARWDAGEAYWEATPGKIVTTFRADGTPLTEVSPDGQVKTWATDGSCVVTIPASTSSDGSGTNTAASTTYYRADGTMSRQAEIGGDDTTYDARGTALQMVHANGTVTRYNPDGSSFLLSSVGTLVSVTLSDGTGTVWNDVEGLWEGSAQDGTVSSFDPNGRLLTQVTLDGRTTTWASDGTYQVVRVDSTTWYRADGTRTRFVNAQGDEVLYDAQDRMRSAQRADGSASRYNVDGSRVDLTSTGTVSSVKLADGTAATWNATDSVWLATSSDGAVTRFDAEGTLLSRTTMGGEVTTYAGDETFVVTTAAATAYYRADGSMARTVTAAGEDTQYDGAGSPTYQITWQTRDDEGKLEPGPLPPTSQIDQPSYLYGYQEGMPAADVLAAAAAAGKNIVLGAYDANGNFIPVEGLACRNVRILAEVTNDNDGNQVDLKYKYYLDGATEPTYTSATRFTAVIVGPPMQNSIEAHVTIDLSRNSDNTERIEETKTVSNFASMKVVQIDNPREGDVDSHYTFYDHNGNVMADYIGIDLNSMQINLPYSDGHAPPAISARLDDAPEIRGVSADSATLAPMQLEFKQKGPTGGFALLNADAPTFTQLKADGDRTSNLWRIITACETRRNFQLNLAIVMRSNQVLYGTQEYRPSKQTQGFLHGNAGNPGQIHLNHKDSVFTPVASLFHEMLHNATDMKLSCVPKSLNLIAYCPTYNDVTQSVSGNWKESIERFRLNHAWIYLTEARFVEDLFGLCGTPTLKTLRFEPSNIKDIEEMLEMARFDRKHNPDHLLDASPAYLVMFRNMLNSFGYSA